MKNLNQLIKELTLCAEELSYNNGLSFVMLSPTGQTALTADDMKALKVGRHFTPNGVRGLAFASMKKVVIFSEMIVHADALKKILPSFPRSVKEAFAKGLLFPFIAAFTKDGTLEFAGDLFSYENFDATELKKNLNATTAESLATKLGEQWSWVSFVFPDIHQAFRDQILS